MQAVVRVSTHTTGHPPAPTATVVVIYAWWSHTSPCFHQSSRHSTVPSHHTSTAHAVAAAAIARKELMTRDRQRRHNGGAAASAAALLIRARTHVWASAMALAVKLSDSVLFSIIELRKWQFGPLMEIMGQSATSGPSIDLAVVATVCSAPCIQ